MRHGEERVRCRVPTIRRSEQMQRIETERSGNCDIYTICGLALGFRNAEVIDFEKLAPGRNKFDYA
jgi:hypothetical protein